MTGDFGVLDELMPFLDGPPLRADEQESFFQPSASGEQGTLFEHCARALDDQLPVGGHGLPLMGTGDWNDGMNRVGIGGKGESIWLGWFLHATLWRSLRWRIAVASRHAANAGASMPPRSDSPSSETAGMAAGTSAPISTMGQRSARRRTTSAESIRLRNPGAYYPGAAEPARALPAMAAVDATTLIRREERLVCFSHRLFDTTTLDPGYIKGYPPGIRENGGQYTSASGQFAFAMLGDGDKASRAFSLLNPINHARTRPRLNATRSSRTWCVRMSIRFAAHVGRGGWTWYTGSAGWMYRAGLDDPRLPAAGNDARHRYRIVATLHDRVPVSLRPLTNRGRDASAAASRRIVLMANHCNHLDPSPCPTATHHIQVLGA